jgi:hypothetical protein
VLPRPKHKDTPKKFKSPNRLRALGKRHAVGDWLQNSER